MSLKHLIIVLVQILSAAVMVLGGSYHLHSLRFPLGLVFILAFILLTAWAVFVMRRSKLRLGPRADAKATLVTTGPYHYIRHPMYTSLFLLALGCLIAGFNLIRLIAFCILIVALFFKIRIEEKNLLESLPDYKQYAQKTKRFIPFLF
jgi:protein-S-isoprenylcysteine O-methyltransferase Ste14